MLVLLMLFTLLEPALLLIRASAGDSIELVPTANKMIDDAGVYPGGYNNEYLMGGYQKTEGTVYGYTESMLKFDLSSIDSTRIIQSAKLEIHIDNAFRAPYERDDMQPHLNLYGSHNDNWEEDNVRVNLSKDVLIIEGYEAKSNETKLIDVASFIHSQINDGTATFVLRGKEIPSELLDTPLEDVESVITVFARSHSSKKPRLLIEYVPITAPNVETGSVAQIGITSAIIGAEVVADGGKPVTERGIEYRQSGASDYTKVVAGAAETGHYTVELTGLSPSTSYEARAYATNAIGTSYGNVTTFTTKAITATMSADQSLTEGNLDGRKLTVTLSGTTFKTPLNASDITLQNAPTGLTMSQVERTSNTEAVVTLSFDGTDFDSNHALGLTIAGTALASGLTLIASPTLPIVATNDPESITLSQLGDIWEGEENGKVIVVTLAGGTFAKTLTPSNWTVGNLPAGVSKGTVVRVDAKTVHITLNGNATSAYAGDIANVQVSLTTDEYDDSTGGGALSANSGVVLKAHQAPTVVTGVAIDVEAISASLSGEVTSEGTKSVTERGIEYRKSGAGSYTKVVAPSTGLGSYDIGLTGLEPNTAYEYRAYATNAIGTSYGNVVTFTTKDIAATMNSDQPLTEENLHGRKLTITLSGTTFKTPLNTSDFTLQNALKGLTISQVERTNDVEAIVTLSFDGTDFDSNHSLGLTVAGTALTSDTALVANPLLSIVATNDPESITLSQVGEIWEGEEDGKKLVVTLEGGTFAKMLNPTNWTVSNLPLGVSKGTVARIDSKTVHITLNGNATAAYSGNITNVTVNLTTAEYDDSTGGIALSANSGIVLKAHQAPTVSTGTATDIAAKSASLGGEVTSEGTKPVTERGIEYRKGGSSDNYTKLVAATAGGGVFVVEAIDLEPSTTYEYRAYAINGKGKTDDVLKQFTTTTLSQNADLQSLILSNGSINESFSPNELSYTANVSNQVRDIQITATSADLFATMKINGQQVASGQPSQLIPLQVGSNTISIEVAAQDGTQKTYTISIKRAASSGGGGGGGGAQPQPESPIENEELSDEMKHMIKLLKIAQYSRILAPMIGQRELMNQAFRYIQNRP